MSMTEGQFDGYDCVELLEYFEPDITSSSYSMKEQQELLDIYLREVQADVMDNSDDEYNKDAKMVRQFLDALIEQSDDIDYYTPLWRGLSCIESDYTFISAFRSLIPHLWS